MVFATNLEGSINTTQTNLEHIEASKLNTRLVVDCHLNRNLRSHLIDHYEELCYRKVVLKNVLDDLKIKFDVITNENNRCVQRSRYSTNNVFIMCSFICIYIQGVYENWLLC